MSSSTRPLALLECTGPDGTRVPMLGLGRKRLLFGRADGCDVQLPDLRVSRHQAVAWRAGNRVFVRSLCHTTSVAKQPMAAGEVSEWPIGTSMRFAARREFFWRMAARSAAPDPSLITDERSGVRFVVGRAPLRLPADGGRELLLVTRGAGRRVVVHDGISAVTIPPGERVEVLGRELGHARISASDDAIDTTVIGPPFALSFGPDDDGRVVASIEDLHRRHRHVFSGESQVALLRVLAEAFERNQPAAASPWVSDEDLATGIWGNQKRARPRINALVSRLRTGLEGAGLPAALLRREPGATQLVVGSVALD